MKLPGATRPTITRDSSDGLIALVLVATDRLSWISAASRSSPIRLRQRVSDERSNTSLRGGNQGETPATIKVRLRRWGRTEGRA